MNLMFYNFNDFNNIQRTAQTANGKRPGTSGAKGGMHTQTKFYDRKGMGAE